MTLTVLDIFSGIGGFSLGLERTGGFKTVAFCEIEPYCRAVLRKHWPDVPIFEDVIKLGAADVGPVDVICGGFPCQDISVAGKQAGIDGERSGLWSEYARLIGEIRPQFAIIENVSQLLSGHTRHDLWPDRCLCGWAYRWRRVLVCPEDETLVHAAPRYRNGRQGAASIAETAPKIRRKPFSSPQSNGSMGRSSQVGIDGQAAASAADGMPVAFSTEEGTGAVTVGADEQRRGNDQGPSFRIEPQGADCDARGRLVCPSCGRQVANGPAESYRTYWFHRVLGDLAALGYDAEWHCIPASAVGAPHRRDRIWIMAYATRERFGEARRNSERSQERRFSGCEILADAEVNGRHARRESDAAEGPRGRELDRGCVGSNIPDAFCEGLENRIIGAAIKAQIGTTERQGGDGNQWIAEPDVGRVASRVPSRVDRLKALGNAVVPQVVEVIGNAILTTQHRQDVT